MLSPLDNEVIFKLAFTDKEVFTCFVKDIIGIDIIVNTIETEKRFSPKTGNIDFSYDIFAESSDHRVIIEIQKVEYDYHYDRFLLYHNMALAELQKSARQYKIEQEVFTIVILTNPYKGLDKKGNPIRDEVLISSADPRNLADTAVPIYGHKLILLNPHHRNESTPENYSDWLDLIYESVYNRNNYNVNMKNHGVKKAVNLIEYDNLTPEQRREMKEQEGKRVVLSMLDSELKEEKEKRIQAERAQEQAERDKEQAEQDKLAFQLNMVKSLYTKGMQASEIAEITGLSMEKIKDFLT